MVPGGRARAARLTLGLALMLSALTVHFRDIRDMLANLLTFWFFATPIIYPMFRRTGAGFAKRLLEPEPVHAPGDLVSGDPVLHRDRSGTGSGCWRSARVGGLFLFGYFVFDRLRDSFAERKCRLPARHNAIEVATSRRSTAATATAAVRDAEERAAVGQPDPRSAARRDVPGARRRVVRRAEGPHARRHRPQRIGQEHDAEAASPASPSRRRGTVTVDGRISALIELGAGFHPEISGRENVFINGIMLGLSKREIARRFDEIVEFAELRTSSTRR